MALHKSKVNRFFPCDATTVKLQGNETHVPLVYLCLTVCHPSLKQTQLQG